MKSSNFLTIISNLRDLQVKHLVWFDQKNIEDWLELLFNLSSLQINNGFVNPLCICSLAYRIFKLLVLLRDHHLLEYSSVNGKTFWRSHAARLI